MRQLRADAQLCLAAARPHAMPRSAGMRPLRIRLPRVYHSLTYYNTCFAETSGRQTLTRVLTGGGHLTDFEAPPPRRIAPTVECRARATAAPLSRSTSTASLKYGRDWAEAGLSSLREATYGLKHAVINQPVSRRPRGGHLAHRCRQHHRRQDGCEACGQGRRRRGKSRSWPSW